MAYEGIDRAFTREDDWTSDRDITAAGDALVSVARQRSGRVPMLVRARLEPSVEGHHSDSCGTAEQRRWYLFRIAELEWTYDKVSSRLLEELKAETTEPGSDESRDG